MPKERLEEIPKLPEPEYVGSGKCGALTEFDRQYFKKIKKPDED